MSVSDFSAVAAFNTFLLAPSDIWYGFYKQLQQPDRPKYRLIDFLESRHDELACRVRPDFLYFESICGGIPFSSVCLLAIPDKGGKPYGGKSLEALAHELRPYLDEVPHQVRQLVMHIAALDAYRLSEYSLLLLYTRTC
jgi:hypothetical protein